MTLKSIEERACMIDREDAVDLDEDEYFIADLIGMKVYTEDGSEFGTLKDVYGDRS